MVRVRLKPSLRLTETYTESNFLRLHTCAAREPSVRLVTLEHLRCQAKPAGGGAAPAWQCQTIVDGEPMTKEDALFIAKSYAAENGIPVIYECHSE